MPELTRPLHQQKMNQKSPRGSRSDHVVGDVMGEEEVLVLPSERTSPMKGAAHATSTAAGHLDIRELIEPRSAEEKRSRLPRQRDAVETRSSQRRGLGVSWLWKVVEGLERRIDLQNHG
jgi:hypothetical protein